MSRTVRKTDFPHYFFAWNDAEVREWDLKAKRDGQSLRHWTQIVKRQTRRERRRDWRKSEHEILRFGDADVPRREKKYLGEIWNWD